MTIEQIWQNVLEELKIAISPATFKTFFSQTCLVSLENNLATVGCPNAYFREQVELRYYSLLKDILDRQTKEKNSLIFVIRPVAATAAKMGPLFEQEKTIEKTNGSFDSETGLYRRYTFDTFVVGNSNNFAHAAGLGIVKNPGGAYNPFFVWGGVGVGKTHLIQAIGYGILKAYPDYKVLYVNAETFTNELVAALKNKTITAFKKKFRSPDVLLVDDIQFIAGKEYSQEEFFHTFNNLHMSGRQIVLTSDRKPEDLAGVEERLVSRFAGGLTVDMQLPDFETRVAIIKQKCQERNCQMTEEAIQFMAQTIESNVRDIEGNLTKILARAGDEIATLEFVKSFFGVRDRGATRKVAPKRIVGEVGHFYQCKHGELIGPRRTAKLALARQVAMYLLRKELSLSLLAVAVILGRKDHTTVIHAVDKISRQFSTNLGLRKEILAIRERIYG